MNKNNLLNLILVGALVVPLSAVAGRGIVGKRAPELSVDRWYQLPKGKETLNIEDYRGKVVYLYCFQSWCPGCHASGFPTLVKLTKSFKKDDDVVFIAIQTAFEGFGVNTPKKAKAMAKKYGLKIPIGHSGSAHRRSAIMMTYQTGGTPWTVIIDKKGLVRFNDFHIRPDDARILIKRLKRE